MITPVILSGGSGTRLWPLSRNNTPKQFLPLFAGQTLFQSTAQRAVRLPQAGAVLTVCADEHRFMVGEQLQQAGVESAGILLEPVARNTAPAIALAALHQLARDADAMLLVLPADHLIGDEAAFASAVQTAIAQAQAGALVTFGITPAYPETGYGYIRAGAAVAAGVLQVAAFVEKPDSTRAQQFVQDGGYYWNAGMFLFRAQRYVDALAHYAPSILQAAQAALAQARQDLDFVRVDAAQFAQSPSDSIDYALMEKTSDAVVVPVDCGWNDIGAWSSLWQVAEKDASGNVLYGDTLALDTRNSYLRASEGRMLATLGMDDVVVVDTADAVLVARRDNVQEVKTLVATLQAQQRTEHLHHRKVYRPWGSYDVLAQGEGFQVKAIEVKVGAALSLQRHQYRAEHWVVVSGSAEITRGEEVFILQANQSTYIPPGCAHRLRNHGAVPLEVVEVQSGVYLGEDDIERLDDLYGRCD